MAVVYLVTNLVNGKYYVGKTRKPLRKRFQEHIKDCRKPGRDSRRHFQFAIKKYGSESFTIEALTYDVDEKSANELERLWIAFLCATKNGYNMSAGGDGFNDPDGKIRARISCSLKGRTVPRDVVERGHAKLRGRKMTFTQQHILNMRAAWAKKKKPKEQITPEEHKARWSRRMSESAKRRWAENKNCDGSRAALALGRTRTRRI